MSLFLIGNLQGYSIAGVQDYKAVSSRGSIIYTFVLGLWSASSPEIIPAEAKWVVVGVPNYSKPRQDISVILNWYDLHPPYPNGVNNPIVTETDVKTIESQLKTVQASNLWGIIGPVCEEHYRSHMQFEDNLNTTWFDESLLGYSVYLTENAGATRYQWQDEMFLRFVRGFYNYFKGKGLKVGITADAWAVSDIPYFYGQPAFDFIRQQYDFVFLYAYTENLTDFQRTKEYYTAIDQFFQKQLNFWILTRGYDFSYGTWEVEAKALELKNCLDRRMIITTSIYEENPTFSETWILMLKAIQLYNGNAPYFETYVNGTNLLTGHVGNTYGWVQVS
jgi:hypothetical protein